MHSLVFVTIFRNSVFLFPNYGTLTKTETAGAALNFFCISSIHFIRFYSALQLPSDCPPTALRVSFRYPRRALFIFVSVIIPHFSVDIRGHSGTTFGVFTKFSAFVVVVRIKSKLPLFFRSGSLFCTCLALAKAVAIPYNKLLLMHKQQGKKSHDR